MIYEHSSCAFATFAPSLDVSRLLTEAGAKLMPADIAEFYSINGADLLKVEKKHRQNGDIEKN